MRRVSPTRLAVLYLRRHHAVVNDGSIADWMVEKITEGERLEYLVRTFSAAVPCPEPHRSMVKTLMRRAGEARRRALRSPPGSDLQIAVLEWHLNAAMALATVQLPYSAQAMRGRRRVVSAGEQRRLAEPRSAAARMKRMGKTRSEAGELLRTAFPDL